jgi:hypothetical protein
LVSASLEGCLDVHPQLVFVVLSLSIRHTNEDGCVPITQRVTALVERQCGPATRATPVLVDVLRIIHSAIIDHAATLLETQTVTTKMTSHYLQTGRRMPRIAATVTAHIAGYALPTQSCTVPDMGSIPVAGDG